MKKFILPFMILVTTSVALANKGVLDGTSFCRTAPASGSEAQSADCIEFSNGMATDHGPTVYGKNPPSVYEYQADQVSDGVWVLTFGNSLYQLSKDGYSMTEVRGSRAKGVILERSK